MSKVWFSGIDSGLKGFGWSRVRRVRNLKFPTLIEGDSVIFETFSVVSWMRWPLVTVSWVWRVYNFEWWGFVVNKLFLFHIFQQIWICDCWSWLRVEWPSIWVHNWWSEVCKWAVFVCECSRCKYEYISMHIAYNWISVRKIIFCKVAFIVHEQWF